jgi:hypothetical protein
VNNRGSVGKCREEHIEIFELLAGIGARRVRLILSCLACLQQGGAAAMAAGMADSKNA